MTEIRDLDGDPVTVTWEPGFVFLLVKDDDGEAMAALNPELARQIAAALNKAADAAEQGDN